MHHGGGVLGEFWRASACSGMVMHRQKPGSCSNDKSGVWRYQSYCSQRSARLISIDAGARAWKRRASTRATGHSRTLLGTVQVGHPWPLQTGQKPRGWC
jgi:hypothetical protein